MLPYTIDIPFIIPYKPRTYLSNITPKTRYTIQIPYTTLHTLPFIITSLSTCLPACIAFQLILFRPLVTPAIAYSMPKCLLWLFRYQ